MKRIYRFLTDSRAAVLPFAGIGLFMLLTVIGLVYDLGHLYVVKQELQNAADAGATAGAQFMFGAPSGTQPYLKTSCELAQRTAMDTVKLNRSDGKSLDIPPADAQVGVWDKDATGKYVFTETPCSNSINAVHVITRRTQAVNGPVPTLFARVLGRDFTEVTANATAIMGWVKKLEKGRGFPLAVDKRLVPPPGESMPATLSSSNKDNGCWHTFNLTGGAATVRDLVAGTDNQGNPVQSPTTEVGQDINLINGWQGTVLQEMQHQFQKTYNNQWTVILPVIDASMVDNNLNNTNDPNYVQEMQVLGYVAFDVKSIDASGNPKSVTGQILGGYVAPGEEFDTITPGGQSSLRGGIPKMVY